MTKFKVGDIVVGNQDSEANGVKRGHFYEVVATELGSGYDFIKTDLRPDAWVLSERFDLYKAASQVEQDDPLPPAPKSVLYNARSDQGCNLEVVSLKANEYYDAHIRIGVWNNVGAKQGKVTCLTPDAALQLAHDLNRMANEIKRREKQRG